MKVEVYCDNCFDRRRDDLYDESCNEMVAMEIEGNLFTNKVKDQSQGYKCKFCGARVTVTINTLR